MPPIKSLQVRSVWDGLWDHPAHVSITILIELEPSSSHVLLDLAGHSENTASVCSIRKLPVTPLPMRKRQRSEHQDRTPIASTDRGALQKPDPRATDVANNEMNVDDTAPSAKRRLFPILRSGASDIDGTELAGKASLIEPETTEDSGLLTRGFTCPSPFDEGTRSISNTTVQRHAIPDADHTCLGQTNCGEAYEGDSEMATLHSDLPPQHNSGAKLEQKAKENVHRKPWQTPSQEDFLPAGRSVRTSSKHSSSIPAIHAPSPGTVLSTTHGFTPLRMQRSSDGTEAEVLDTSQTIRSRSGRGSSSETWISITPTTTLDGDSHEEVDATPCDDKIPSLKLVGLKHRQLPPVPKSTKSSIPAPKVRPNVDEPPSPDVSPRIWLRRHGRLGSSGQWFNPREPTAVYPADDPSWKIQGNKLEVCFANCPSRETYTVDIEASIRLSTLDDEGWLDFILPGLPQPDDPVISGRVHFRIEPPGRQSSIDMTMDEAKSQFDRARNAEAQFDTRTLHDTQIGRTQIFGRFWVQNSRLLRTRLKSSIYRIVSWDASISLSTTPIWLKSQAVQLKYHARFQMKQPKRNIFSEQVVFSFHIKHGPLRSLEYILKSSRCSVLIEEDIGLQNNSARNDQGVITIYRDTADLGLPLDVYFWSSYTPGDQATIALPTLCPGVGKVLSECILLTKPSTPLVIEHLERAFFSSWKRTDLSEGSRSIMRFDRVELPQLFPEGLKDDVIIRIKELCPVQFSALETSENSLVPIETFSAIWNMDIQIDRVCGQYLVCRMDLLVAVGNDSERLLTFDAHNWVPELSFIDGRLATQRVGEWRKDEDGYLTLCKSPAMITGRIIRIEMRWRELIIASDFKGVDVAMSNVEYHLPTIIGKSVLGGSLTCNDDNVMLSLDDGEADGLVFHFSKSYARNQTILPKLSQGYSLQLSFHQMLSRSPRIVRFADEPECCSETSSNRPLTLGHNETRVPSDEAWNVSERSRPSIITSSVDRPKTVPLWRLPLKLARAGFRCVVIPFLFIYAAQLVAQVGHRFTPSSIENLFSTILGSNAGPGTRADCDLGYPLPLPSDAEPHHGTSGPSGEAVSNPAILEATTGGLYKQRLSGEAQDRKSTVTKGTSERLTKSGGLIDWIDRALGWKEIRL